MSRGQKFEGAGEENPGAPLIDAFFSRASSGGSDIHTPGEQVVADPLPLRESDFHLSASEISNANVRELFHRKRENVLLGPPAGEDLNRAITSLLPDIPTFLRIAEVDHSTVDAIVTQMLVEETGIAASNEALHSLKNDIVTETRAFLAATRQGTVELRLSGETVQFLQSLFDDFFLDDFKTAAMAVKDNIEYLRYSGAFIYHKDDFGINMVRSYAGPATLCFGPEALSQEQGLAMMEHWIEVMFGENGPGGRIPEALMQGDRKSALADFNELLGEIRLHQLNFEGSGNTVARPYVFPTQQSVLYFGDQNILESAGGSLLFHARPLWSPFDPSVKRLNLFLETLHGQDVTVALR